MSENNENVIEVDFSQKTRAESYRTVNEGSEKPDLIQEAMKMAAKRNQVERERRKKGNTHCRRLYGL
jgi:hypothetical protein